jgi:Na+/melibiose symporter-like transporter
MSENQLVDKERGIHRAKQWEIALFSLNNVGVNVYLFAFSFLTYYSTGVAGFAILMVANMLGAVRLFDGLVDPAIGLIIDKFSSKKWGKYRPIMLVADQAFLVILFGILLGSYAFSGQMALIQIVPNIVIILLLTRLASIKSMKTFYTTSIIAYILSVALIGVILFVGPDTTQIFAEGWGVLAVLFTIGYIGLKTFGGYPNTAVMTISADIADYELNRTGKNKAEFVSTVFTFAESISSALIPNFIGFSVALIGYTEAYPAATDALTSDIFNLAIFMVVLLPLVFGLFVFLIRKYPLDKIEMEDIQASLSNKRNQTAKRNAEVALEDLTADDMAADSIS